MDSGLVKRGLNLARKKRKWLIILGLIGFSSYGMYKVYNMPSMVRKRKRISKLFESFVSMAEMVADSSETITVVSRDLKEFLRADSDEIPNSLKQLSKIARSEEFSQSVIRVSQAMTIGILRGYKLENGRSEIQQADSLSFPDRVMDKLMSSAGTGFVSVVVGSFARNLVLGLYAFGGSGEGLSDNGHSGASFVRSSSSMLPGWLNVVSDDKCKVLLADCIRVFVSTAVAVYLDKTMEVNFFDEMFSGLTDPKHQHKVTDVFVSLCNGAVETLVKTSHQVLTASKNGPASGRNNSSVINQNEASRLENNYEPEACIYNKRKGSIDLQRSRWVNSVSSTLAVPSNRKFVLDVTGRVTFETVRSVIQFFSWKILEDMKKSLNVVHDKVVDKGFEVVRYVGAKSSVILTICLALFLHILGNTRVLVPA